MNFFIYYLSFYILKNKIIFLSFIKIFIQINFKKILKLKMLSSENLGRQL